MVAGRYESYLMSMLGLVVGKMVEILVTALLVETVASLSARNQQRLLKEANGCNSVLAD